MVFTGEIMTKIHRLIARNPADEVLKVDIIKNGGGIDDLRQARTLRDLRRDSLNFIEPDSVADTINDMTSSKS